MKKLIVILCFVILLGGVAYFLFGWTGIASDAEMETAFANNRDDFEVLSRMAREDSSLRSLFSDFVMLEGGWVWRSDPDEGFSSQRHELYRSHFRNIEGLIINRVDKLGDVLQFGPGSVLSEGRAFPLENFVISKGIAYSEYPVSPVVESLDGLGLETPGTFYKSIGGPWHIYRDYGMSKPE